MKSIEANHYTETILYSLEKGIRKIKADIKQYLSSILTEITPEQFFALDTIYANKNCCQKDLSEILVKDKAAITRIAEILESKNLIKRVTGRKNNRLAIYLEVTESGKALVEAHIQPLKEYMMTLYKDVTDEEVETLKRLIEKFS